ncbi:hypothetical protein [Kitasatospora sp. NPDC050463]|uniref:hypothetical protein n=1 Tax=Kitasatospora sp. NPDC050463 TaxID=3155786 RepID=UPI0033ED3315
MLTPLCPGRRHAALRRCEARLRPVSHPARPAMIAAFVQTRVLDAEQAELRRSMVELLAY